MTTRVEKEIAVGAKLFSLLVLAIILIGVMAVFLNKAHTREVALKREILAFQRVSMPALRARGWGRDLAVEDVLPRDLQDALNPCTPESFRGRLLKNSESCAETWDVSSYGGLGRPIKILVASEWPR